MGTKIKDENFPSAASINGTNCFTADRYLKKVPEKVNLGIL